MQAIYNSITRQLLYTDKAGQRQLVNIKSRKQAYQYLIAELGVMPQIKYVSCMTPLRIPTCQYARPIA